MIDLKPQKTKVFVSGSSHIKELSDEMLNCLNELMARKVTILVGDCYGVDLLVQKYLRGLEYKDVVVYCSSMTPRKGNCLFPTVRSLWELARGKTGAMFFEVKDDAMTKDCDEAVAFWNGVSHGVKCNIERCRKYGKPIRVFVKAGAECVLSWPNGKTKTVHISKVAIDTNDHMECFRLECDEGKNYYSFTSGIKMTFGEIVYDLTLANYLEIKQYVADNASKTKEIV